MAKKYYSSPEVDFVQYEYDVITVSVDEQKEDQGGSQDNIYSMFNW